MIPKELSEILTISENEINSLGDLPASQRLKIYNAISKYSILEHQNAASLRMSRVALICAKKTIDALSPFKDIHSFAFLCISNATKALRSKYDLKTLESENGELYAMANDLLSEEEVNFPATYAGMSCFAAINTVLYDLEESGVEEKESSPEDWSAAFYSAISEAGSASWEEKGGEVDRHNFWLWFLRTAVPDAWDVHKEI